MLGNEQPKNQIKVYLISRKGKKMILDKLLLSRRGGACLDNKHKTKQVHLRGGAR